MPRITARRSLPDLIKELLVVIGEDPGRPELRKTPERSAKALSELTSGYSMEPGAVVGAAIYPAGRRPGLVVVRDIVFYSLCEHHLLPFFGKVSVGYLPRKKIIGLSKIPRIVRLFARRLQIQERLTEQIAGCLDDYLNPLGVGVVIQARHMCLEMQGVKSEGSAMTTSAYLGKFKNSSSARLEFLKLIGEGSGPA